LGICMAVSRVGGKQRGMMHDGGVPCGNRAQWGMEFGRAAGVTCGRRSLHAAAGL